MTKINRSALVPYSPKQMFDLVNRIEDYPQFLPWCQTSEIISQDEKQIQASLCLAWSGIRKTFTTQNDLIPYHKIGLKLLEGPFSYLEGHWEFMALGEEGCKVNLDLDIKLKNSFMDKLIEPIIHNMANTLVDAFCKRAIVVYGQ